MFNKTPTVKDRWCVLLWWLVLCLEALGTRAPAGLSSFWYFNFFPLWNSFLWNVSKVYPHNMLMPTDSHGVYAYSLLIALGILDGK